MKLQKFEYSEIQSLVFDSIIGKPSEWNRDSPFINYKPVVDIDFIKEFELRKIRRSKDFFRGGFLDTTNFFVRSEFSSIIQSNEKIISEDSAEYQLNINSRNYTLNFTKDTQRNYFSNDTIGKIFFYPLFYNESCSNAIQICKFHKGMGWGFCEGYFLKKLGATWSIVGKNILWIK